MATATTNLCGHLRLCCEPNHFFIGTAAPPASCGPIVAADDPTACEVALLAVQAYYFETYHLTGLACGSPNNNDGLDPQSNPTCEALDSCCSTISNALDADVCSFTQGLHFATSCAYVTSYLQTKGHCGSVDFDAGTWPGIASVDTSATGETEQHTTSAATAESHSSGR
jgi:hypothetical protein